VAEEGAGGVALSWKTEPGPEADVRYRIERAESRSDYLPIHAGVLDGNEIVDSNPGAASRYRLIAINGLGEASVLGETAAPAFWTQRALVAYPNPALGGRTRVQYRVNADAGPADLCVFDVAGRRVRRLDRGTFAAGVRNVEWDGRDDDGRLVGGGVYMLRLTVGSQSPVTERIIVVR
jgi:hypothetical protein